MEDGNGGEHRKGEYLDMDDGKRRQLDEEAQEYVGDVAGMPAMNADAAPHRRDPSGSGDTPEATES
jgi:hypothetical protein